MCGIVGYIGKQNAAALLIECLGNLEYRGYDSAGIALLEKNKIATIKGVGRIKNVFAKVDLSKLDGHIGLSHSRWATHGGVTDANAHPHISPNGQIAVVHNGIIENYQELKRFLTEKGYSFKSETDTEVIPVLIQYYMEKGKSFEKAVVLAARDFQGSFALGIINAKEEKLIGIRNESPLVLGIGTDGYFIASDVPSFLDYTKKVVYLNNMDMAVMTKTGVSYFNIKDNIDVKRNIDTVEWDKEQAKKGNFEHFMLKEITEQAEMIKQTVSQSKDEFARLAEEIRSASKVFFVAAGSSYHSCLSAFYKFASIPKKFINTVLASEFSNFAEFIDKNTLIVAVSQSGETADVLEAVRIAKEKGAKIVSIVNVKGSSLTRCSDYHILQNVGPELCVLATKSYTSQIAILTLLAYALADKFEEGRDEIHKLIQHLYYLTSSNARGFIKNLAERLRYTNHLYLIGRDSQYPTAMEAALKIKEVTYIHAEGFAGGELKHGTIALIEPGTPCIVFTSEENEKRTLSNAMELKARGGFIVGIGPKNNEVFDFFIKVREAGICNSISQIIPIQILAYQLAVLKGLDPDKPRNLAKSVTVK